MSKKYLSTITYNTKDYLEKNIIPTLIQKHYIDYARYIFHKGEINEETGEVQKDHCHIILHITKTRDLNLSTLQSLFNEFDPTHPDKPLGCKPFRQSDPFNWTKYELHDEDYLKECAKRKNKIYKPHQCHYQLQDIKSNIEETTEEWENDFKANEMAFNGDNSIENIITKGLNEGLYTSQILDKIAQLNGLAPNQLYSVRMELKARINERVEQSITTRLREENEQLRQQIVEQERQIESLYKQLEQLKKSSSEESSKQTKEELEEIANIYF